MKITDVQYSSYEIQSFLLIEKLFTVIKNLFSKKTEIVLNQYKHLIELSPEPIVILDEDKIVFANEAALILFGAENEKSLINNSMLDFVEESYKDKARESLAKIIISGEDSVMADVKVINLKNDRYYIQGMATEIFFDNRKAILVMLRDISDMKKREKELEQIAEEAKKVEQMKSQFLTQMSHEIRSPLHAMMIAINLLEDELAVGDKDKFSSYFNVIRSSSKRITKMVELILNSAELSGELYKPSLREINLKLILTQLVMEYRNTAQSRGIQLSLSILNEHTQTFADEYSVTQIFSNLVDNAIKYTEEGKVDLILKRDEDFRIVVEIIDTGVGISKEYLPKIFNEFSQESNGYSRKYEGSGLGLTVVKKFCDLNNIEIVIESSRGKGTIARLVFLIDN